MAKPRFKVYDLYDYPMTKDVLGYANSYTEIAEIADEWIEETDGECCIYYAELNPETGKYKFTSRREWK